jgi:hypothetical protein
LILMSRPSCPHPVSLREPDLSRKRDLFRKRVAAAWERSAGGKGAAWDRRVGLERPEAGLLLRGQAGLVLAGVVSTTRRLRLRAVHSSARWTALRATP